MRFMAYILASVLLLSTAWAVEPDEILKDPVLEERARVISKDLRCLVCQNQSIDDSDADLAKDLRVIVRERLTAGDDNDQVIDFVVSRYGNYVLLDPPMNMQTLLLWVSPVIFLLLGLIAVFFWFRGRSDQLSKVVETNSSAISDKLTDEEEKRLKELLGDEGKQ